MKSVLTILKIGGNVIDHADVLSATLSDFVALPAPKVLVHGGGKIASDIMCSMGIEPKMVDGRRITDRATLDIVTMVYAGLINKNMVAALQKLGCNAIGLTGADANIIPATKRPVKDVDFGFVGDLTPQQIDATQIAALIELGLTPVLAPVTHDKLGTLLNTNADTIASSVAIALTTAFEVHLVFCFDKNGVLSDPLDETSVIPLLTEDSFKRYKSDGVITAGMLPKLQNAFVALRNGVCEVRICSPSGLRDGGTKIRLNNIV